MRNGTLAGLLLVTAGCAGVEGVDNSQAGWRIASDTVDLFVTENGAHMAPVRFCTDTAEPGQALIDRSDLKTVLKEQEEPFLYPEHEWEKRGMTGHTTVSNGLVYFKGKSDGRVHCLRFLARGRRR